MNDKTFECCNNPICICGEAYRGLTDHELHTLAKNVVALACERQVPSYSQRRHRPMPDIGLHSVKQPTEFPSGRALPNRSVGEMCGSFRDGVEDPVQWTEHGMRYSPFYGQVRERDLTNASGKSGISELEHFRSFQSLHHGVKFKFLEAAGENFKGEWVVTGMTIYDEENGPKHQVVSVKAQRGEETISFYTSYSNELVDETMVPFVSMSHIEMMNASWDIVPEPANHNYGQLKVGKTLGLSEEAGGLGRFTITKVEYVQKNYGLTAPEQVAAVVTVTMPVDNAVGGELTVIVVDFTIKPWDNIAILNKPVVELAILATEDKL